MDVRTLDDVPRHKWEKGWHTEVQSPHLFIDTCVQIWADADFAKLNRYGVTAYLQTTFMPFEDSARALDAMADWWRVAREYPEVRLALTARDIEEAHRQKQAAIILGTQGGDHLFVHVGRKGGAVKDKGVASKGDAPACLGRAGGHVTNGGQIAQEVTLRGKAFHEIIAFLPRLVTMARIGFVVFSTQADATVGIERAAAARPEG